MKFLIRKMKMGDISRVRRVAKTSWHQTYDGMIPYEIQEKFLKSAYNDDMLKRRMERSAVFVAAEEDKIVGFANFSSVEGAGMAELKAIYLCPVYQGKGIRSALLEEGIRSMGNVKVISVDVEKENKAGMSFCEARGFKKISEFDEAFDGHILKTVRMVLRV